MTESGPCVKGQEWGRIGPVRNNPSQLVTYEERKTRLLQGEAVTLLTQGGAVVARWSHKPVRSVQFRPLLPAKRRVGRHAQPFVVVSPRSVWIQRSYKRSVGAFSIGRGVTFPVDCALSSRCDDRVTRSCSQILSVFKAGTESSGSSANKPLNSVPTRVSDNSRLVSAPVSCLRQSPSLAVHERLQNRGPQKVGQIDLLNGSRGVLPQLRFTKSRLNVQPQGRRADDNLERRVTAGRDRHFQEHKQKRLPRKVAVLRFTG